MANVINIGQLDDRSYNVLVEWVGLDGEPSWEPVGDIFNDAPQFLLGKRRKMGLSSAVKQDLRRRYDMRIRVDLACGGFDEVWVSMDMPLV